MATIPIRWPSVSWAGPGSNDATKMALPWGALLCVNVICMGIPAVQEKIFLSWKLGHKIICLPEWHGSVAYFVKEVNQSLAKLILEFSDNLHKLG